MYFMRKTIIETEEKLNKYYTDSASSCGMVHKWFTEFRSGQEHNRCRTFGRPIEITTEKMVNKIHAILLKDHRAKEREIAKTINISNECVFNILHEYLGMKKLSSR